MQAPARLDAETAMIVLADLQPQIIAHGSRTSSATSLRKAVSILAEAAGVLAIPVFNSVIRLGPDDAPETIEEVRDAPSLARSTFGVFDDEGSRRAIAAEGRILVAVGGVSSEVAVLQAVLGAVRVGHSVHVLTDACGGLAEKTERAAFRQMEAAGATMSSVASFMTSMLTSMDDGRGRALISVLSRSWS